MPRVFRFLLLGILFCVFTGTALAGALLPDIDALSPERPRTACPPGTRPEATRRPLKFPAPSDPAFWIIRSSVPEDRASP